MKHTTTIILIFFTFLCHGQTNVTQHLATDIPQRTSHLTKDNMKELDSLELYYQTSECYHSGFRIELDKVDKNFPRQGFYLLINQNELTRYGGFKIACKLYLINTSDSTISLEEPMNIFPEALDSSGNWLAIGHNTHGYCGNAYREFEFGKDKFWTANIPVFKGSFKTKLRYVLQNGNYKIYSNEIVAYINKGQFKP
jgi:hypothetical protein